MNSKTILIVDDEPFLRSTLAMVLGRVGYSIQEAASAQEAIQAVSECDFDLIFLDLKMPGKNGLELLPEIAAQHPDIPILVLTADGSLEKAIEALRLGAKDYLLKPVDPGQIILKVDDLLREGKKVSSDQQDADEKKCPELSSGMEPLEDVDCSSKTHTEAFLDRGPFHLEFEDKQVFLYGSLVEMDNCTFEYLATLLRYAPHPVPYDTLVFESQGYQLSGAEARDVCRWRIHRLSKIIEADPQEPRFVLNVPGIGYQLKID